MKCSWGKWFNQAGLVGLGLIAGWNIGRFIEAWRSGTPWRWSFHWFGIIGMVVGAASSIALLIVLARQEHRRKRKRNDRRRV